MKPVILLVSVLLSCLYAHALTSVSAQPRDPRDKVTIDVNGQKVAVMMMRDPETGMLRQITEQEYKQLIGYIPQKGIGVK